MNQKINPAVSVVVVLLLLGGIYFAFTHVFTGKVMGMHSAPAPVHTQ